MGLFSFPVNGPLLRQIRHLADGNGPIKADSVNDLSAISAEPNVTIMETKALTCAIMPGRVPRRPQYLEFMKRIAPPGGKFTPGYGQYGKTE